MSAPNAPDPSRNDERKVIVLKMPSTFKFDSTKNFLAANSESGQSVFSFKPHQLLPPTSQQMVSAPQKVQVIQQGIQSVGQKIGPSPGTILIRAQPSTSKTQFATIASCPNVKIQEVPLKVNKEPSPSISLSASFRNKTTSEFMMKTQSGQAVLIPPSSATISIPSGAKTIPFSSITTESAPPLRRFSGTVSTLKVAPQSSKPVAIRPKVDYTLKVISQQQAQRQILPKFPAQHWQTNTSMMAAPVPALTPILHKVVKVEQIGEEEKDDDEDYGEPEVPIENTPQKVKKVTNEEQMREVRRIIEGVQDEIELQVINHQTSLNSDSTGEEAGTGDSSSAMLLCDEIIECLSVEVSPIDNEKSKGTTATPMATDDDESKSSEVNPAVQEVKKNLENELNASLDCDKENYDIIIDEESVLSDESSLTDNQRSKMQDYEESLMTAEISKQAADEALPFSAYRKPKRVRKPKHPTIISTLGLPYKPSQPIIKKTKNEKKLEFELDFHDPLNKILWEDGIGALNNCNKLFGFDEFGLIEVITKKDARAKLKQIDASNSSDEQKKKEGSYKLRKITDKNDQYACSVCSKLGTIRDFYSPECCSEACIIITRRKGSDLNVTAGKDSSSESGMSTPIDDRKLMFDGEMVPIMQMQQTILERELPPSKQKRKTKTAPVAFVETKFQWDTYLTNQSIPAGLELFRNPYPNSSNPFKVGMKLEAVDPENQKMICVCTVEEKLGFRIKLHFDGYPVSYDFWVDADSPNIFPSEFCHNSSRTLQKPPKWSNKKFDWSEYLDLTNSIGAQRALFPRMKRPKEQKFEGSFEVGMKLEIMRDGTLYVASIIDVIEDRVLISHDGHEELGCVWLDARSPYLHPCNYHKTIADPECFVPPSRPFDWTEYLKTTGAKEAPAKFLFFRRRLPNKFEAGLKLEVVDRVNRQLIRPATVLSRDEYKIQVLFDGFDISYAYWLDDDSEDIHPINWCEKTGHPIEHPAGFNKSFEDNSLCSSLGCRGIGNACHADRYFHDNVKECPYAKSHWQRLLDLKLGSHLDAKVPVKRSGKRSNRKQLIGTRQEADDVEEFSEMEIEEPPIVVEKVVKKRGGRKRKAPVVVEEPEPVETVVEKKPRNKVVISKDFLDEFGPQINYAHDLWKKNSKVLDRASVSDDLTENPMGWSVSKVASFVQKVTDAKVAEHFKSQEIDGAGFVCMSQEDLVELLELKLGAAIKIYNRIMLLREQVMRKFLNV